MVQQLHGTLGRELAEFQAVLDALPQGVVVRDAKGRTVFANESAIRMLGLEAPAELLSTPLDQLSRRFEFFNESGEALDVSELPGIKSSSRGGRQRRDRAGTDAHERTAIEMAQDPRAAVARPRG